MDTTMHPTLLFFFITSWWTLPVMASKACISPGDIEMTLQERLYQADIILYGQDLAMDGRCPKENPGCARAPHNFREYSNFRVYCVIKNNGPRVPANFTIFPRKFGSECAQTTFREGMQGWVHIVTVKYEGGKYYWDEINKMAAYSTVYIVNTDEKIQKAARLCNLPVPVLPDGGGADAGCPVVFNQTRNPKSCFKGCERDWLPIGGSCYWFGDPAAPATRNEAAAACLLQDSHLVAIETQAEETQLTYVLNAHVDTEWWSSGTYRDGQWVWQDGIVDLPLTFNKWRRGEPGRLRGEADYMVILYRRDRWGWRAVGPTLKLPYICEKERGERAPITLSVCQNTTLQASEEGRVLCSVAIQKVLLTSSGLWPNVTHELLVKCAGKTPYDDINCLRNVRRGANFVMHLLGRSAFNPYVPRQELALTFTSLPGNLLVCGQQYSWSRIIVVQPHLGDQMSYGSWYFRPESKMAARWSAASGKLYSLIILDLGLFAVHGAWVNIPGGNLTDAQVVQKYVPLVVATPDVPASFAFMVFQQKSPAFLTDAILEMLRYSPGKHDNFNLTKLSEDIGFQDLVAVNFVTSEWDPYSAWYFQQKEGYSNHCPHYVQMAYRDLEVPSVLSRTPFSLIVEASFEAGREFWTMCCKKFSISGSTRQLDPYGTKIVAMTTSEVRQVPSVNLTRGNVLLDGRGRRLTFRATCLFGMNDPLVPIDCSLPEPVQATYDWYTLLMVDIGILPNVAPSTPLSKPRLHWLVIDVPDGDIASGKTVVPYKIPAPDDKFRHFYVIYAFKQKLKLGSVNHQKFATENCTSFVRCEFDVMGFMQFYDIELAGANWFSVEADNYTLYELIRKKLASPADACRRRFPETRTYGPLVVCESPVPQLPSVRPIIGGATSCRPPRILLLVLGSSVLMLRDFLTRLQ